MFLFVLKIFNGFKEQKVKTAFVVTSGGVIKTVSYILGIKTLKESMALKIQNLEMVSVVIYKASSML